VGGVPISSLSNGRRKCAASKNSVKSVKMSMSVLERQRRGFKEGKEEVPTLYIILRERSREAIVEAF